MLDKSHFRRAITLSERNHTFEGFARRAAIGGPLLTGTSLAVRARFVPICAAPRTHAFAT